MKLLKLVLPIVFVLLSVAAYADDNSINGTCPGEIIQEIDGTNTSVNHIENGRIGGGGNDRYRMMFNTSGTLDINVTNRNSSRNARYDFYVSRNSCGNADSAWNIVRAERGTSHFRRIMINSGDTIWVRLQSRTSEPTNGRQSYALSLSFTTAPTNNIRNFTNRFNQNIKGNVRVIGNTVLFSRDGYGVHNNRVRLAYVNTDSNTSGNFNSSSATIESTYASVNIASSTIKWAGLYWQGYLHSDDADTGLDTQYGIANVRNTAHRQIRNLLSNQTIRFRKGSGAYANINPDQLNWHIQYDNTNVDGNGNDYVAYKYGAFADLTTRLQGLSPSDTYTIANIPTREGRSNRGNRNDGLGNYGAWTLVVVYDDNSTSSMEKTRNVTVYDGYLVLNGNTSEINIPVSGFKTPKDAPNGVDSTLSVFAGEGDTYIPGDFFELINQDNVTYRLSSSSGSNNFFNSSVEGVSTRNINLTNNMGIDIHTQPVGTNAGSDKPIGVNQTSATIHIGTNGDHFVPSMVAFATELFTPHLCYDYDVRIGDRIKLPNNSRRINTHAWGSTPLKINTFIRSERTDFPLINTQFNIAFSSTASPANRLTYIPGSSEVSPPDRNSFIPVGDINSGSGVIGIGKGTPAVLSSTGGRIDSNESTYAKQSFHFLDGRFDGQFDIFVNGFIQFDPTGVNPPSPFSLSTAAPADSPNYLPRCNVNPVYDPIWMNFNVERTDSYLYAPPHTNNEAKRYPLYTQISGKDFNVSLVSYTKDNNGAFNTPLETNATVELELIDAALFENNASVGYDSTCEKPDAIGDGAFINFASETGVERSRVTVHVPDDIPNFDNNLSLRSATFRIWVLATTEELNRTRTIVQHSCKKDLTNADAGWGCFRELYTNRIRSYDTNDNCLNTCTSSYSPSTCYSCLREFFSMPICARDNFAIRPESFRIQINDNNETDGNSQTIKLTDNSNMHTVPNQKLAAEYKYLIEANATLYNSSRRVDGYYNDQFIAEENLTTLGSKTKDNIAASLEFKGDNVLCTDTNHRTFAIRFQNGEENNNTYIRHDNVGDYHLWMLDSNWTLVDQATYIYKPRFGDCITGNTDPMCYDCDMDNPSRSLRNADGKLGCVINSNLGDPNPQLKKDAYVEIPLRFEPYKFKVTDINLSTPNGNLDFVYINDVNATLAERIMSARFNGDLTALGRNDTVLSNFTSGCAAHDVTFDINLTTSQCGLPIALSDVTTAETVPQKVTFKRNYVDSTNTPSLYEYNGTKMITIKSSEFKSDKNGSATVDLFYNFNKPKNGIPVNPVSVTFLRKDANSTDSASAAHLIPNFIPKGIQDINQSIDFYLGSVLTIPSMQPIPRAITSITLQFYVEAFCDLTRSCCATHSLGTDSTVAPNIWWINNLHTDADGGITDLTDQRGELQFVPSTSLSLTGNPNTSNPVNIPPTTHRTYDTHVNTLVPVWLNSAGADTTWLGGGGWAGPGKTGLIVDTNASEFLYNKRTGW